MVITISGTRYGDRDYWAEQFKVSPSTVRSRCRPFTYDKVTGVALYREWDVEDALVGVHPRPTARGTSTRR